MEAHRENIEPIEEYSARQGLLFQPPVNPFEENTAALNQSLSCVPRYLLRLCSPESGGRTTLDAVASPASIRQSEKADIDLLSIAPGDAAKLLDEHLRWKCNDQCNLMSWTSSLPFALQHGLRRHEMDGRRLSEIYLLVVDTRHFVQGTFLRDVDALCFFSKHSHSVEEFRTLTTEKPYYFGEYLTQGRFDVQKTCSWTHLQSLLNLGIFHFCPVLENPDNWQKWAKQILALRTAFRCAPLSTAREDIQRAARLSKSCLGDSWALPMTIMVLAMARRERDDETMITALCDEFPDEEIKALCTTESSVECRMLPEVKQYRDIIRDMDSRMKGSSSAAMYKAFEALGL